MKTVGRPLLNCLIIFSSLVVLPVAADAALIAVANTYASSEVSTDRAAIHATNGSNLVFIGSLGQEGDPAQYTQKTDGTGTNTFGQGNVNWLSKTATAVSGTVSSHWFAVDLGSAFLLDALNFFNFSVASGSNNNRGINQADLYYRTDSLGNNTHLNETAFDPTGWTLIGSAGSQTFTLGPNGAPQGPDTVALSGITARYFAIDVNTNLGNGSGYAGIGEVQFFGSAVPEPGKASLFLFAAVLGVLRRRR